MSRRVAVAERSGGESENYPTPEWAVHRLLDTWEPPGSVWLEPCAGEGAIISAVRSWCAAGEDRWNPKWEAVEIRSECRQALGARRQEDRAIDEVALLQWVTSTARLVAGLH